jgi:excisionase family DNA binding protein
MTRESNGKTIGRPNVLTAEEAAAYLRVSTVLVRRLAQAGELPGMKVGRQWRFRRDLIDEWLAGCMRENLERSNGKAEWRNDDHHHDEGAH